MHHLRCERTHRRSATPCQPPEVGPESTEGTRDPMSSPMKDARWQIALRLCEELGIEWDNLIYAHKERLLYSAQQFLDLATDEGILKKAEEFNNPDRKEAV